MTASMPSNQPRQRFIDIRDNAALIETFIAGMDLEAFGGNSLVANAVERCLSRISEAAVKLGPLAEEALPHHGWPQIRTLGNVLRHAYDRVDAVAIWSMCTQQVPALRRDVDAMLADRADP